MQHSSAIVAALFLTVSVTACLREPTGDTGLEGDRDIWANSAALMVEVRTSEGVLVSQALATIMVLGRGAPVHVDSGQCRTDASGSCRFVTQFDIGGWLPTEIHVAPPADLPLKAVRVTDSIGYFDPMIEHRVRVTLAP